MYIGEQNYGISSWRPPFQQGDIPHASSDGSSMNVECPKIKQIITGSHGENRIIDLFIYSVRAPDSE